MATVGPESLACRRAYACYSQAILVLQSKLAELLANEPGRFELSKAQLRGAKDGLHGAYDPIATTVDCRLRQCFEVIRGLLQCVKA